MNRVGMVVDGSHTGFRTTMEAMEISDAPFIFSHSGAKAVNDHVRNITDEQIRACAQTGGVIGCVGVPFFAASEPEPRISHIVDHIRHMADLVGPQHVGIGMDYYGGTTPWVTLEEAKKLRERETVGWDPGDVPTDRGFSWAPGIETPRGLRNLTAALLTSGFTYDEARGIMGENFVRVFADVWKPVDTLR